MPNFLEDPSVLTKDKLKSELLANSVALPPGEQRKDVYVQLYKRHLSARNNKARDFSSDEEREATPRKAGRPKKATKKTDKPRPEEADDFDVTELTNEDLKEELLKYGLNPGPIMVSTRKVYEKRLLKLKEQAAEVLAPPAAVSSTAEESKQNGNDSDQYSDDDDPEIILKLEKREPLKKTQVNLRQTIVEHNQTTEDTTDMPEIPEHILERLNRPSIKAFPHEEVNLDRNNTTFSEDVTETSWTSGSTRTGSLQTSARETAPVWRRTTRKRVGAAEPFDEAVISGNLPVAEPLTSSNQTFTHSEYEKYDTQQVGNKITGNFKQSASLLSSGDFSGLPRRTPKKTLIHDEVLEKISTEERKFDKDILKKMFPYEASTPTGISVSRRRPIKGAAGRPVPLSEYKMEESYSTKYVPNYTTLADVKSQPAKKGRSLPVWIKILLFILVAVFLFLVYQAMETNEVNPFPTHHK